jgi:hypothetical protein
MWMTENSCQPPPKSLGHFESIVQGGPAISGQSVLSDTKCLKHIFHLK